MKEYDDYCSAVKTDMIGDFGVVIRSSCLCSERLVLTTRTPVGRS